VANFVPLSLGRGARGEGMPCRVTWSQRHSSPDGTAQAKNDVNLLPSSPFPLPKERGDDVLEALKRN